NERGLITESMLGSGSPTAISKQTEWHTVFDKPVKITTSGSITEFSYADNGDLNLKGMTDRLTGEQRQWRYNYEYHDNRMLAELTIDGPRHDVADISVTKFDLQGNTLSQTNALGHQVRYGHYDQMGNPGYKVNINGLTTEFDYDARGRLLESRVSTATPAITRYQYNAMGQLIKTTRPKGDSYQYEYDAAYRKVSESDALGQTKNWLLDTAGNALESTITGDNQAWQIETCLSSSACLVNAIQITEQVADYRQQRVFDGLSRVVESSETGSLISRNEYDVQGNLVLSTDA
ncbi:hypothetical protein L2755_22010, partial [Shewanella abyssi]|uniref:hypothetical protein n=1 Tax=Shewanella abyssi TaxID=311789 RepID=UPI003D162372|nr:hypothetical protein [Shewanella abyssi]